MKECLVFIILFIEFFTTMSVLIEQSMAELLSDLNLYYIRQIGNSLKKVRYQNVARWETSQLHIVL